MQILFSRLDSITFSNVCGLLGLGIFVFCLYGLLVSPLCKFPTSNILISELEKKKKHNVVTLSMMAIILSIYGIEKIYSST